MSIKVHKIIFSGDISDKIDMPTAKHNLMLFLKTDAQTISFMFKHGNIIVMTTCYSFKEAMLYKAKFDNTGAICSIIDEEVLFDFRKSNGYVAMLVIGVIIVISNSYLEYITEYWYIATSLSILLYMTTSRLFHCIIE